MAIQRITRDEDYRNHYPRVREWLLQALEYTDEFDERTILKGLIEGSFQLWVTDRAVGVTQVAEEDQVRFCNLILVAGERGRALREVVVEGQSEVIAWAKANKCVQLRGTPRKEWTRLLLRDGFQINDRNEFYKEI